MSETAVLRRLVSQRGPQLVAGWTVLVLVAALVLLGLNAGNLNPAQLGFEIVLAAAVLSAGALVLAACQPAQQAAPTSPPIRPRTIR